MRRGAGGKKRDDSEAAIVHALRQIGVVVLHVSGADVPDLLLFHARTGWTPAECKTGKGQLTKGQLELQRRAPFPVFRNVDDALQFFRFFVT